MFVLRLALPLRCILKLLLVAGGAFAPLAVASAQGPAMNSPAKSDQAAAAAKPTKKKKSKSKAKVAPESDGGDWIEGDTGAAKAGKKGAKGVRTLFAEAQAFYDSGKYSEALAAFDALVRKYPQHEPARIMIAKSLYRMDRVKEAYGVFTHLNPQHLDPETSYEFSWSFYTMRQWEGALAGFQRVPKGHALFDLANYYGAICAIKLKKYDDAEDMLDKAVVLPDKLAKSRSLYIKHVQALRLMKEKGTLAKERQAELDQMNKEIAKEKGQAAAKTDPKAPEGYQHKGQKSVSKVATVSYTAEHQYIDNHALKEDTFDAKIAAVDLKSGPLLPIPGIKIKDRQAAFGLTLKLGAEDRITRGNEVRVLADQTTEDLARLDSKTLGTTDVKTGKIGGETWVEFPLPEGVWWALGGEINFVYPEFSRGQRTGDRKGYTGLGGVSGLVTYSGEISYSDIVGTKTKPVISIVGGTATTGIESASKLGADVTVTYQAYDYMQDVADENYPTLTLLDGPDTLTRGEVSVHQGMPLGFKGALYGAIEQDQNYLFHDMPTFGQLAANGQVLTGKVSLSAAPLPWLSASIAQTFQKTKWTLDNAATRDVFEINVPDYLEKFVASITLNLAF